MTPQPETLVLLRDRIREYLEKVETLEKNRKPAEGIFGLKGGPKDDPCHDRFAADLSGLFSDFSEREPESSEVCAVLQELFLAADAHRDVNTAFWMLLAVQGLGQELIERLSASDAALLYDSLKKTYPRRERFPVQKQLLEKLKSRMA